MMTPMLLLSSHLRGNKEHNTSVIAKAVTGPFRLVLHYLWYSSCLPLGLVRLAHKQINWQLVLASNGKLLAVVQDQCVEISERWHGATTAPCWATLDSTGTVRLFDRIGSELFVIPPSVSFPGDFSCAVAGLIFLEYTGSAHWSAELLVITYGGGLKSYLVSVGTNQNFQQNHSFSFSSHYSSASQSVVFGPLVPGFDEINPEWKTSLERRKKIKDKEQYYPPEDVSWWSDVVLILARCSGSVTVSSVRTLRNLLGKSCEWFEPSPRVTAAHKVVFLSLEILAFRAFKEERMSREEGRAEIRIMPPGSSRQDRHFRGDFSVGSLAESLEVERTDEAMQVDVRESLLG
ncbi:hypothetical protein NQZ68_005316 [Dissostichus eleginoides]|nr:hypothetical protein NQZ68_005316 [Dissostichus eleginoides]